MFDIESISKSGEVGELVRRIRAMSIISDFSSMWARLVGWTTTVTQFCILRSGGLAFNAKTLRFLLLFRC